MKACLFRQNSVGQQHGDEDFGCAQRDAQLNHVLLTESGAVRVMESASSFILFNTSQCREKSDIVINFLQIVVLAKKTIMKHSWKVIETVSDASDSQDYRGMSLERSTPRWARSDS